ncbi:MAG: hypothetical protein ACYTGQ_11930 [Planctomycetota bacterium]
MMNTTKSSMGAQVRVREGFAPSTPTCRRPRRPAPGTGQEPGSDCNT